MVVPPSNGVFGARTADVAIRRMVAVLWLLLGAGCAEGYSVDAGDTSQREQAVTTADAPIAQPEVPAEAPMDEPVPGVVDGGAAAALDPCVRGEIEPCICEDTGTEGQRRCVFDATSPFDGYLSECRACAPPEPCADGALGENETDVDCGGPECPGCALGAGCVDTTDCEAGECIDGACTEPPEDTVEEPANAGAGGAGGAGSSVPEPEPEPEPVPAPSASCSSTPSLCRGAFACCKPDGTCGSLLLLLCI